MLGKVCTKPVVVATGAMPVTEAARLMRVRNVGALVVVNNGKPVGILTDRDIAVQVVGQGKDPAAVTVGAIMRRSPTVIRAEAGILDAVRAFSRSGVRRLPVVSRAGKLVGIIALDDVLMLLGREMGLLAQGVARGLGRAAA